MIRVRFRIFRIRMVGVIEDVVRVDGLMLVKDVKAILEMGSIVPTNQPIQWLALMRGNKAGWRQQLSRKLS